MLTLRPKAIERHIGLLDIYAFHGGISSDMSVAINHPTRVLLKKNVDPSHIFLEDFTF